MKSTLEHVNIAVPDARSTALFLKNLFDWSIRWQGETPGKGYSVTMERPEHAPRYPMLFPEHKVGVSPFDHGLRWRWVFGCDCWCHG